MCVLLAALVHVFGQPDHLPTARVGDVVRLRDVEIQPQQWRCHDPTAPPSVSTPDPLLESTPKTCFVPLTFTNQTGLSQRIGVRPGTRLEAAGQRIEPDPPSPGRLLSPGLRATIEVRFLLVSGIEPWRLLLVTEWGKVWVYQS